MGFCPGDPDGNFVTVEMPIGESFSLEEVGVAPGDLRNKRIENERYEDRKKREKEEEEKRNLERNKERIEEGIRREEEEKRKEKERSIKEEASQHWKSKKTCV